MADLGFLQALRDSVARQLGQVNWTPASAGERQWQPVQGPGVTDALTAGDALFHRLGPAFDPLVSGMHQAFGYSPPPAGSGAPAPAIQSQTQPMSPAQAPWAPQPQANPTSSPDPSIHYWQPVPHGRLSPPSPGSFAQQPQANPNIRQFV